MTEHEAYRQAFDALAPKLDPDRVRAMARAGKGVPKMKRIRPLRIALIAVLAVLLLAGGVTAAGTAGGWLLPALSNIGVHPELLEKTLHPAVSATVGEETWTVDELLVEGDTVYFQVTRRSKDGSPLSLVSDGKADWLLYLMDEEGVTLSNGFGGGCRGSRYGEDESTVIALWDFTLFREGPAPDWSKTKLLLYLEDGSPLGQLFPKLMVSATPQVPLRREAALADGRQVWIGRFSVELDPAGLVPAGSWHEGRFSVLLADGTEVTGSGGSGIASPELGPLPGHPWRFEMTQVLDPEAVTALRIGDTVYPLQSN